LKNALKYIGLACFSAVLAVGSAFAQEHTASTEIDENHAGQAMEWLQHFINPDGVVNYDSVKLIGYSQLRRMDNRRAMQALSSAAWVEVGKSQEGRVSGRPSGIAFDPGGTLYLATTNGGLWKSTNNGQNWTNLSNTWKTLNVGDVAVDPNHPMTIYAGTGIHLSTIGGGSDIGGIGVYKSLDGGLNWTLLDSGNTSVTTQMEINPANTELIYRATTSGVRISTDGGETWTNSLGLSGATSIVLDATNPAILYAGGASQIKKSLDSGKTWETLSGYPTGEMMVLAMSRTSSDTIYLSTGYGVFDNIQASSSTLALSTDGGQTWTTQSSTVDYMGTQAYYDDAIAVNPTRPENVVVGGLDVYSSVNGGVSLAARSNWQNKSYSSDFTHADVHVLKYNPYNNTLFALTDGGIFYSSNNGTTWKQDMNATLGTFLFVGGDMAVDQNSGAPLFFAAGAQDNGLNKLIVGQQNYYSVQGGDGGTMFISPYDNSTMYGTYVGPVLYRSDDSAHTWQDVLGTSQIQNEGTPFYMEYDVYDQDPNVVAVCGNQNVYLTTDGGSVSGPDFPRVTNLGTGTNIAGNAVTVHIARADDTYMYIGTSARSVYRSEDMGQTWTKQSSPSSFTGTPTSITTDPNDPTHVYMTVSIPGGNGGSKHFYVSTDTGKTWTSPATNLPNLNYRRVAVDNNGVIYVGHDYGVLRSGDGGATWYQVADGFPMAMVTSLRVRGHYLVAATYGRGMFYVDLSQLPPLAANAVTASNTDQPSAAAITAIYPSVISSNSMTTHVDYSITGTGQATLEIYDVLGRQERVLVNSFEPGGEHEIQADLTGLAPGQHYLVLTSGGRSVTKPITIE